MTGIEWLACGVGALYIIEKAHHILAEAAWRRERADLCSRIQSSGLGEYAANRQIERGKPVAAFVDEREEPEGGPNLIADLPEGTIVASRSAFGKLMGEAGGPV